MPPEQEAPVPTLYVTGGAHDGAALSIDSPGLEKLLGSGPDCHLRLQAQNVDYHHAQVSWEAEGVLLSDLGSSTGTYVNGEKVETTRVLMDGDRVCIGPPGSRESVKLLARVPEDLDAAVPIVVLPEEEPMFAAAAGEEPFVLDQRPPPPVPAAPPPAPTVPERVAPPAPPAVLPLPGAGGVPAVIMEEPVTAPVPRAKPDYSEAPAIVPAPSRSGGAHAPLAPAPARTAPRLRIAIPALPATAWGAIGALALLVLGGTAWLVFRTPPPTLASISPVVAAPGQAVTLTGTSFAEDPPGNTVWFGESKASVTSASETSLTVTVPRDLSAAGTSVPVSVQTGGGRSAAIGLTLRRAPRAIRLQPDVALPGAQVTLAGQNLDMKNLVVRVDSVPAEVLSAEAAALRFLVPVMPVGGGRLARVVVTAGADSSAPLELLLGRLPYVEEVMPGRARVGDRVTVKGRGFDPAQSVVTIGGAPALVVKSSATELAVAVPDVGGGGGTVQATVVVQAKGASSEPAPFSLERPSSTNYVPRFFAAGTGDRDTAFVSVELGPVMLLAADGGKSAGERALDAVGVLNGALQARGAESLRFEVRGEAVGIPGQAAVVVRATSADAAAYAREAVTGMRGQRVGAPGLAAHWAALLQDLVTLFLAHQRPLSTVERNARARVLLEIYAESVRRGGAGGVPMGVVDPLPTTMARSFRELTLQPAAGGRGIVGAAVSGSWEGTLVEEGVGEGPPRVRMDVGTGKLTGTLTTRAGAISVDVPLRELAYDKGTVSFVAGSGTNERRFKGSVQGAVLSGTVQAKGHDIGRFSLRFLE
jgi:hypothetical protein